MIVRKIRPEEYQRVEQFCSLAFNFPYEDSALTPEEALRKGALTNPDSRQQLYWQSQWAAFEDDDRTMMSTFTVAPYRASFDGNNMLMMGIGGVATLPQFRKRGGVRACFEHALPDMYEQGAAFSYLYPFSTAFYRKFGYELGCERDRYRLGLRGMPRVATDGSCRLLEPATAVELEADIRAVYAAWEKRYNLLTIDEDIEYSWIKRADPFRDRVYTHVYRAADGTPKGYVTYAPATEDGESALACSNFCFVDLEGFYGLLNLLLTLSADYAYATMYLPTDVELGAILPEWSFGYVQRRREQDGMVRVVNVEKALRMARMRGAGSLVLDITDAQIAQNTGRFEVRFEDGHTADVRRTDAPADVTLSIQDFSRLISGRYDLDALMWLPNVKLACPVEKAARVFYRKPMYIIRRF